MTASELDQAARLMQEALLRELGDEVELILAFGSRVRRETHHYSDLDVCYIPAGESTWKHITVLLDERLIDLFALPWSRFEQMAEFNHVFCTILINSEIIYQRTEAAAQRFYGLRARFRTLQQPEARPAMVRKAQEIVQKTGYQYYLLRQAAASGHQLAAMRHAQEVLKGILHSLAVLNQTCIDTRKLDQVLALPTLPPGFEELARAIMTTTKPTGLLQTSERLLDTTRALLIAEQAALPRSEGGYPAVFRGAYPEFKAGIQHLLLASERQESFTFELMSLYHELMIHMAMAETGLGYSDFYSIAEYEQDLAGLGFPDLLSFVEAGDYAGLQAQIQRFDARLQTFLDERGAALNAFDTLEALQQYLDDWQG